MNEDKGSSDLRSRLQKIELDKPSATFSSAIMKEIEDEPECDLRLQNFLLHAIEQAPTDFTERVLRRVKKGEFESSLKPVISRRAWGAVVVTFIVLAAAMLSSNQATPAPDLSNYFIGLGKKINTFVSGVPVLYMITFSVTSVLLLGDYVIRIFGTRNRLIIKT